MSLQAHIAIILALAAAVSLVGKSPVPIAVTVTVLLATAFFNVVWNDTIPRIFGARSITFGESFRLLLLGWLLSGGVFIKFLFAS